MTFTAYQGACLEAANHLVAARDHLFNAANRICFGSQESDEIRQLALSCTEILETLLPENAEQRVRR